MAVEEQSSQDSTLIDDDLVAALGFEPVTTIDVPTDDATSTSDDEVDEVDEVASETLPVDDLPLDDVSAEDEASPNDDAQGFGINDVDAADVDASEVDLIADGVEVVGERASFFDLDGPGTGIDTGTEVDTDVEAEVPEELDADGIEVDGIEVDGIEADLAEVEVAETGVDEAEVVEAEAADDPEVVASDLETVASIADDDVDPDATAPVGLIDLDSDHVDVADVNVDDAAALDESALDVPAPDVSDVIDLEVVDLSDAPVEVHELADADSVFADATPVLDPEVFDGTDAHLPTETVEQVGSGLLDLDTAEQTAGAAVAATAATATPTKRRRRLRARKSRRVIRHIDPWSVLTFSVLFHMVVFAALLLSSVLVWNAAIASGMVENVESFIQELGDYETFEINADVMFRAAIVIAGMLTLASSVLVVLLTVVFNLISDLVGGIRVTVIEEETVRVPMDKKRSKA